MGLNNLKEAVEKYEAATEWMANAKPEDIEKHYDRYLKVLEVARMVMNEYVKTLGYDPFKNYGELIEAIENI